MRYLTLNIRISFHTLIHYNLQKGIWKNYVSEDPYNHIILRFFNDLAYYRQDAFFYNTVLNIRLEKSRQIKSSFGAPLLEPGIHAPSVPPLVSALTTIHLYAWDLNLIFGTRSYILKKCIAFYILNTLLCKFIR